MAEISNPISAEEVIFAGKTFRQIADMANNEVIYDHPSGWRGWIESIIGDERCGQLYKFLDSSDVKENLPELIPIHPFNEYLANYRKEGGIDQTVYYEITYFVPLYNEIYRLVLSHLSPQPLLNKNMSLTPLGVKLIPESDGFLGIAKIKDIRSRPFDKLSEGEKKYRINAIFDHLKVPPYETEENYRGILENLKGKYLTYSGFKLRPAQIRKIINNLAENTDNYPSIKDKILKLRDSSDTLDEKEEVLRTQAKEKYGKLLQDRFVNFCNVSQIHPRERLLNGLLHLLLSAIFDKKFDKDIFLQTLTQRIKAGEVHAKNKKGESIVVAEDFLLLNSRRLVTVPLEIQRDFLGRQNRRPNFAKAEEAAPERWVNDSLLLIIHTSFDVMLRTGDIGSIFINNTSDPL